MILCHSTRHSKGSLQLRLLAIAAIVLGASLAWGVLGATLLSRMDASDTAQRGAITSSWGAYRLEPSRSRINVTLDLTQRREKLLWYNTYTSAFHANYRLHNEGPAGNATIVMPFPVEKTNASSGAVCDRNARLATYEDVLFLVDGHAVPQTTSDGNITASLPLAAGQTTDVAVRYTTNGLAT